jgi:lysophospholipase L1-like esterase
MKSVRNIGLLFLLLAAMIGVAAAAFSSEPQLPPLAADAVVVAFGDSLTYGSGAEPSQTYPALLAKLIGRRVVNAGVPGELTAAGLSRLPEVLETEKPALVIICHGANDLLRRLERKKTADNLKAMVRLARERGAAVVLVAVPFPDISLPPPPVYREIAREFALPLEEKTLNAVLADRSLKADYIHPNAAGYRRMAESIAVLLKTSGALK